MSGLLPYNCASLTNVAHFSRLALSWVVSVRCLAFSFLPNFCSIPVVFLALSCHTAFAWAVCFLRLGTCAAGLWLHPTCPIFHFASSERSSLAVPLAESGDFGFGLWLVHSIFRGPSSSLPWLSLPAESGDLGLGLWLFFGVVALSPLAQICLLLAFYKK